MNSRLEVEVVLRRLPRKGASALRCVAIMTTVQKIIPYVPSKLFLHSGCCLMIEQL